MQSQSAQRNDFITTLEAKEIFDEYYLRLPWKLRSAICFAMDNCEEFRDIKLEPPLYEFTATEALNFLRDLTKLPTNARKEDTDFILKLNCAVNALRNDLEIWRNPEDLPHEEWRDVVGYEGLYMVSNIGRVLRCLNNGKKLLKRCIDKKGYNYAHLSKNGVVKHRKACILATKAFIPNSKNKPVVHHRDRNRENDCVKNLEWGTYSENSRYIVKRNKSTAPSWTRSRSKLTPDDVRYIREHYTKGNSKFNAKALAIKFNVGQTSIYNVIHNKSYKDVN